jgi:polysaccharide deacetylase family protein (PEP-CTERM system associated)
MNLLTVDVEEWFHVCGPGAELPPEEWDTLPSRVVSTTMRLLDLLDRKGVKGTFFVVGWIAERHPTLVTHIAAAGHEVGSHSQLHRRVYELTASQFAADVASSVKAIVDSGAPRPTAFRAPEWSINDKAIWALDELARQQFETDASMAPVRIVGRVDYPRHPHLRATAAGPILEVPPLVADRFGQVMPLGWGWGLRLSSPRRVLHAMATANRAGCPAVLTVHPWEIDPDPPRFRLPLRHRFAHYFCLDGFESRLTEIVNAAPFSTLAATARCVRSR